MNIDAMGLYQPPARDAKILSLFKQNKNVKSIHYSKFVDYSKMDEEETIPPEKQNTELLESIKTYSIKLANCTNSIQPKTIADDFDYDFDINMSDTFKKEQLDAQSYDFIEYEEVFSNEEPNKENITAENQIYPLNAYKSLTNSKSFNDSEIPGEMTSK
jgi:hypothetical protein